MADKSSMFPDHFGWWELPERCDVCTLPMHMASGQDVMFCPNCAIDAKNAARGREALEAAKARMRARLQEKQDELRGMTEDNEEPRGPFKFGMPL